MFWVRISLRRGVLDTTLCDKVCPRLATGRWFSPVSSTNKTDRHVIAEILLYQALSIILITFKYVVFVSKGEHADLFLLLRSFSSFMITNIVMYLLLLLFTALYILGSTFFYSLSPVNSAKPNSILQGMREFVWTRTNFIPCWNDICSIQPYLLALSVTCDESLVSFVNKPHLWCNV